MPYDSSSSYRTDSSRVTDDTPQTGGPLDEFLNASRLGRHINNEGDTNQLVKQGLLPDLSMTQGDNANMHPQATASVCGEGGSNIRAGEIVGGENPSIPTFDGIDEGIDEGTDVPYGASVNFDRRQ